MNTLADRVCAGVFGDAAVPAEPARHDDPDAGDAGGAARRLPRPVCRRILDQPAHPVRHGAGDRHRRRRRHRGDRERRAHHARGTSARRRKPRARPWGRSPAPSIAITMVLAAVFVPSALQTGSVGAIYRQFALTIALVHAVLRVPGAVLHARAVRHAHKPRPRAREPIPAFRLVQQALRMEPASYTGRVRQRVRHAPRWMLVFAVGGGVAHCCSCSLPRASCRRRTRATRSPSCQLPPGATLIAPCGDGPGRRHHAQNPEVECVFDIVRLQFRRPAVKTSAWRSCA